MSDNGPKVVADSDGLVILVDAALDSENCEYDAAEHIAYLQAAIYALEQEASKAAVRRACRRFKEAFL